MAKVRALVYSEVTGESNLVRSEDMDGVTIAELIPHLRNQLVGELSGFTLDVEGWGAQTFTVQGDQVRRVTS